MAGLVYLRAGRTAVAVKHAEHRERGGVDVVNVQLLLGLVVDRGHHRLVNRDPVMTYT